MSNEIPPSPPQSSKLSASAAALGLGDNQAGIASNSAKLANGTYLATGALSYQQGQWQLTTSANSAAATGHGQSTATNNEKPLPLPGNTNLPAPIKQALQSATQQLVSSNAGNPALTATPGQLQATLAVNIEIKVTGQQVTVTLQLPAQAGQVVLPLTLTDKQAQSLLNQLNQGAQSVGYQRPSLHPTLQQPMQGQPSGQNPQQGILSSLSPAQLKTLASMFTVTQADQRWQVTMNQITTVLPPAAQAQLPATLPLAPESATSLPKVEIANVAVMPAKTVGEALKQIAVSLRWQQPSQPVAQFQLAKELAGALLGTEAKAQQLNLPLQTNRDGGIAIQLPNGQAQPLPKELQAQLTGLAVLPKQLTIVKTSNGYQVSWPTPPTAGQPGHSQSHQINDNSQLGRELAKLLILTSAIPRTDKPLLNNAQPGQITLSQQAGTPPPKQASATPELSSAQVASLKQLLPLLSQGVKPLDSALTNLQKMVNELTTPSQPLPADGAQKIAGSGATELANGIKALTEQFLQQAPKTSEVKPEQVQQWIRSQLLFQPFSPQLMAMTLATLQGGSPMAAPANDSLGLLMNLLFSGKLSTLLNKTAVKAGATGRSFEQRLSGNSLPARQLQGLQQSVGQIAQQTQLFQAQSSEQASGSPSYFSLPINEGGLFKQVEGRIDPPRDEDNKDNPNQDEKLKNWQLTLKLDVGEHGALMAQARLHEQQLKLRLVASKGGLKRLVDSHLSTLDTRLQQIGFNTEIASKQGTVPATLLPKEHQLIAVQV
ncbi:flagellar hook-length control protein FliK [Corallincola holothuriorum]|uniref:Flagellar hook-length control protein FliK n=1 Tax=Corallincola holothuriorum TaxID=2282215 RepID=A0A368N4N6_9GAMM|nr:flagellar hook-length control protein FliK [Corallincola holothuriorum]RCU44544.1 flagellar hook-length control protein FliK [Corallincola holothuriorum]